MAPTFSATAAAATFASAKSMLALFNGSGSGRVLRLYRVYMLNNQTSAVTGVITTMALRRITALSGGTAVSAVKHDTNSSNLVAQVAIATGGTATDGADPDFMRWMWSNDEPAASSLTNDESETIPSLALVYDATGSSDLEPIVLRENQGVGVRHVGSSAVGNCDLIFVFTDAAS